METDAKKTVQCPDCHVAMEEGFPYFMDETHGRLSLGQFKWHNCTSKRRYEIRMYFSMVVNPSMDKTVAGYRCPECGLIRQYAN